MFINKNAKSFNGPGAVKEETWKNVSKRKSPFPKKVLIISTPERDNSFYKSLLKKV